MVKKQQQQRQASHSEFPILDGLSLYASSTTGDGNCLFRALSDQLYGDETRHFEIRQEVVKYVREAKDHFAAFVGEYGETFDQYVTRLAQDGVYGGHIEIVGFAAVYSKVVVIYQSDNLYLVQPEGSSSGTSGSVHIAYHSWEHYSSVRKIGGPRTGPVHLEIPTNESSVQVAAASEEHDLPAWKIDIVLRSVPDAEENDVINLLKTKDYDMVIEELITKGTEAGDSVAEDSANTATSIAEPKFEESQPDPPKRRPPISMKERKSVAKQRRSERKERLRAKKVRSRSDARDEDDNVGDTTTVGIKIVNI